MKKIHFLGIFTLFFLFPNIHAFSLGHAPSVLNFGEVEAGEVKITNLYLLSDHEKDLLVELSTSEAYPYIFDPNYPRTYDFNPYEASQEDISDWIDFTENPVMIPAKKRYYSEVDLWANKRTTLILKVPKNAEPGYHAGMISFSPRIAGEGAGYKVAILTLTQPLFIFKVSGKAIRSAKIIDFSSVRVSKEENKIGVVVKNNGTVTIGVRIESINVSKDGNLVASLSGEYNLIRPNQTLTLFGYWKVENLTPGVYDVSATVSWLTGKETKKGKIELLPFVEKIPLAVPGKIKFPWWLLVPIILVVVYILYRRMSE